MAATRKKELGGRDEMGRVFLGTMSYDPEDMTGDPQPEQRENVDDMAERLSDAYSTDAYRGGWRPVIKALRRRGYDDWEVEAIVRSKWTRWAGDASIKNRYGHYTSVDLLRWMDEYENTFIDKHGLKEGERRFENEIRDMVLGTFEEGGMP